MLCRHQSPRVREEPASRESNDRRREQMHDPRAALRHVLWIGGPPDAGKSTVADLLAGKYGLLVYHFDRHERVYIYIADPQQ